MYTSTKEANTCTSFIGKIFMSVEKYTTSITEAQDKFACVSVNTCACSSNISRVMRTCFLDLSCASCVLVVHFSTNMKILLLIEKGTKIFRSIVLNQIELTRIAVDGAAIDFSFKSRLSLRQFHIL